MHSDTALNNKEEDLALENYSYDLPEEYIAQSPTKNRDDSRLLVFNRHTKELSHTVFSQLPSYVPFSSKGLPPLFVVNNSKVIPARVLGQSPFGGKRELLLLHPAVLAMEEAIPERNQIYSATVHVLLKPSKNTKAGDTWYFTSEFWCQIIEKKDFGQHKVRLYWKNNLIEVLTKIGQLPLPPYIKRPEPQLEDTERYQTIYANAEKSGSAAAPTAGLHFTPTLKEKLLAQGCLWEEVTLHVGYGTFSPVRTPIISQHQIHKEYFELSAQTVQAILKAKEEERPIIAVGTTACRVLEGAALIWNKQDNQVLPKEGMKDWTQIFIYPHTSSESLFKITSALITNFHLPESSLLMLVSAFAGRKATLDVYKKAVQNKYRFFSYGDAMLII